LTESSTLDAADELSRRSFLYFIGRAAGIGPAVVTLIAAERLGPKAEEAVRLAEVVGPKRLTADASEVVTEFAEARTGDLMPYYQLFWRFRRKGLHDLTAQSNQALRAGQFSHGPFRLRVLPALARIHAIGACLPFYRSSHEESILRTHNLALGNEPDREVLDAFWRTMIGALIRNLHTWKSFTIGAPLIDEAVLLCRQYLAGEKVLFGPAILALQFLLTYEMAIRDRGDDRTNIVQGLSAVLDDAVASRNWWFAQLTDLYKHRHAVLRLMTNSNLVGCVTGRSAGFAPWRIFPA